MISLFTFLLDAENLGKMKANYAQAERDRDARFADVNLDDNWTPEKVFELSDQDNSGFLDMEEVRGPLAVAANNSSIPQAKTLTLLFSLPLYPCSSSLPSPASLESSSLAQRSRSL
jgi:hypothetical protein